MLSRATLVQLMDESQNFVEFLYNEQTQTLTCCAVSFYQWFYLFLKTFTVQISIFCYSYDLHVTKFGGKVPFCLQHFAFLAVPIIAAKISTLVQNIL